MGSYSSFSYEEDISFYDKELYDYCKSIEKENDYAKTLVEWYEKHKTISFEMFDGWKIQSYWYDGFCEFMVTISNFLKKVEENCECDGTARFEYEEGQPFEFILDYKKKEIYVNYTPLEWETMKFNQKPLKIPKEYIEKIEQADVEQEI